MQNLIGQTIGRYHIIEQLGEGGMAVVYKAFDTTLDCDVAVKVLRIDDLQPSTAERTLKRFKREAKETAQLLHPNIVRVTDFGEFEGSPYLVMPYVPGGTLKQKLEQLHGPMPFHEAAKLLAPIARALDSAHKNGVVHRDIKPANILITNDGHPMVTDFGIAKILENDRRTTELTGSGMAIGTPEYMSPEQWMGKELDGRADIYSLGVVFYEMITGHTPFSADTVPAVMVMALRDPLPRPRSLVKELPESVEKVVFKALAREPENRYQTMGEFANALEQLVNSRTYKQDKPQQVIENLFRRRNIYSSLGIILVLIVIAGGFYFWNGSFVNQEKSTIQSNTNTTTNEPTIDRQSNQPTVYSETIIPVDTLEEKGTDPIPGDFHWEFEKDGFKQGWGEIAFHNINSPEVKNGLLFFRSTGDDPYILGPMLQAIDSSKYTTIKLRMKVSKVSSGTTGQLFFITRQDQNWDESKHVVFDIKKSGNFEEYFIDASKNNNWKGIITELRIDPTEDLELDIWIDYIRIDPILENNQNPEPKTNSTINSETSLIKYLPNIPLYDSFDGEILDLTKWSEPPWGNPKLFTPIQKNGELILKLDEPKSWRAWSILGDRTIDRIYVLLNMEETPDGSVGISLNGPNFSYAFYVYTRAVVVYDAKKGDWQEIKPIVEFGGCCSSQHLLGAEATGKEITFYLDGKLIKSYSIDGYPDHGDLLISGEAPSIAHIDSIWVEFAK